MVSYFQLIIVGRYPVIPVGVGHLFAYSQLRNPESHSVALTYTPVTTGGRVSWITPTATGPCRRTIATMP